MSRLNKRRRTKISGQFSWRLIEMQESPAYRVLSLSARRVLDRIEIEFAHHGGTDNGNLPVRFDDFEHYGIHRHSIAPALRELVALRFVEITEVGHSGADVRTVSKYRLTYQTTDNKVEGNPTNEWRTIKTIEEAEALAIAARNSKSERAVALGRLAHERREQRRSQKTERPVSENAKTSAGIHH
jgi:hypothetical protein